MSIPRVWEAGSAAGSAEFHGFGNSAAFLLKEEPQSLKGKTLRYPASETGPFAVTEIR
jgi:hypothetical protein